MILITGAAGKTGLAVISALRQRQTDITAFVNREAYRTRLEDAGVTNVIVGDLEDREAFRHAAQGAGTLYLIVPNMHPHEVSIGENAIRAAHTAGIKHIVYHSVMHPQLEAMPHHWNKLRVEGLFLESGLAFTILQPAAYMQNILGQRDVILKTKRYRTPYPVTTRISLVDLSDAHLDLLADVNAST